MRTTLALVLALSALAAWAGTSSPMPEIVVEAVDLGGASALSIRSDLRGVEVWMDYVRRGTTPLDIGGLSPGGRTITLRKDGYHDNVIHITLAPDTRTTITAGLALVTGYLQVRTATPGAFVDVAGAEYAQGVIELPVGLHRVTLRSFGYVDREFDVFIVEGVPASIEADLEPAPFDAGEFKLSATTFNPRNSGMQGSVRLSFRVTAPGAASIAVRAPDGTVVARFEMGPFDRWEQSAVWGGRTEGGVPVPDGRYRIVARVLPLPNRERLREEYGFEADVLVDSSVVIVPRGLFGALPGALLAPDAFPTPDDRIALSMGGAARAPAGGQTMALATICAGLSLAGALDLGLGVDAGIVEGTGALFGGARLAVVDRAPLALAVALEGRLGASDASNPSFARLSLPLGIGTPFANVILSPDIALYWEDGLGLRAGAGASATLTGYLFGAALSVRVRTTDLLSGLGFDPVWTAAAELRFLPPGLPLSLRAFGGIEAGAATVGWFAGAVLAGEL